MNENEKKVKDILESESVPDQLSPENVKKMLDEKGKAKRKRSRISVAGRITAAAAACAVIVGGAVGTAGLMSRENKLNDTKMAADSENQDSSEAEESYIQVQQAKAPYMSGAESYEQVYGILEDSYERMQKKLNEQKRSSKAFTSGAKLENEVELNEDAMPTDTEAADGVYFDGEVDEDSPESELYPSEEGGEYDQAPEEAVESEESVEKDYSETYYQEENVLEADIFKTDGDRIYYITNYYNEYEGFCEDRSVMNIASVDNGEFTETSTMDIFPEMELEGDGWERNVYVQDMYLYNDMLAVIGTFNGYRNSYTIDENYNFEEDGDFFSEDESYCFVSFYTKDTEPQLIGTYWQDGDYSDVRIAPDGYMYLISKYYSDLYCDIPECSDVESYIPRCGVDEQNCIAPEDILLPRELDNVDNLSYTVIGSIDLTVPGEFTASDVKALAGYTGNVYCSANNLYTAVGWENTDITRISVGGGSIVPEASGTVEGYIKDQFSMSEYNGTFRVASTVDKWEDNGNFITDMIGITTESKRTVDNRVYIMDMDMNIIGSVEGFGEDETIKSVNFSGDMAYVVTYEQTDPLFAIDLSDPAAPFITDEFKILGYSTYMQKWDDGKLLGFGVDADENGRENGVKIVMFDNSDPYDLKEIGLYSVGSEDVYSYSSAVWDRKGLLISPGKNLIGFPITIYDDVNIEYKYMFFSYDDGEFTFRGELGSSFDHDEERYGNNEFNRALYIDDYVYVLSGKRFVSADLETLTEKDNANF